MTQADATQPLPDSAADLLATERWFVKHGLPYFVPEERQAARSALRSRHTAVVLLLTVVVGLALGSVLGYLSESLAFVPAIPLQLVALVVLFYAVTTLRARPILTWAAGRTLGSLRLLVPLISRALPLLLLFVTFLFINTEVWQVASALNSGVLWLVVMLFGVLAVGFLLVRLPEELEHADDDLDETSLVEACRRTPLAGRARDMVAERGRDPLIAGAELRRYEKANLVLVLLIAQSIQILLLSLSVFAFFLLFGALVMTESVQVLWTGGAVDHPPGLTHLTVPLLQVSVFLAAFSGLYFAVYAITDESYRDQFFTSVKRELDRAVAVRAVYLALRAEGDPHAQHEASAPEVPAPDVPAPEAER